MSEKNPDIVFVVDDSRTLRMMLTRELEKMAFKIYQAASGEEALELFNTATPDAILLDVEMSGMGGFATCEKIRGMPAGRYVPIMMVTGLEDLESINKAYRAGATDFATKPINWDIIGHRVKYMVRTSHDYFELQKVKEELKLLNMQLEERVINRTEQLKSANDELHKTIEALESTQFQLIESEKLASLGGLVAGVAHEVNTPLGVSISGITLLKEKLEKIRSQFLENNLKKTEFADFLNTVDEIANITEKNLQHGAQLIKSFKQVAADQISEHRHSFNLSSYLDDVLLSLKPVLLKTKLEVKVNCPPDITIDNYPGVLSRVITIFIMNSIMHGFEPNQQGVLTIEAQLQEGNQILLHYKDSGKGIPPENLKKIFEPFFTTRRGSGGVGLGLNIAYNLVTKIGGTLKCTSTPGQGVVFTVSFPIG